MDSCLHVILTFPLPSLYSPCLFLSHPSIRSRPINLPPRHTSLLKNPLLDSPVSHMVIDQGEILRV
ncbi:hypothetical protein K443DRAFT_685564 [Laccaria amethystina LaAM-08-1]|uniref:Unplaced genomic scaffold K443scaffold_418, whole genome shotgun sequence n=1 Tax=Laccaria amethystina LaAM-08-1 TaxID=1095629 RepID=A0A0C9X2T2_9AGAR|nr:hypothetical protein K443DRAFT_685564 [Laccaria amethystina LaAM-08-1]